MLTKTLSLMLVLLLIGIEFAVAAESPTKADNEAVSPEHFRAPQRHRPFPGTQRIVDQYIAEKTASGEIDPTEYNQLQQQRKVLREEIKALKQSGDTAAVEEKLAEIRQQRQLQRAYVRDLVRDNSELKQRIAEQRYQIRLQRLDRRQDMIERRRERLLDRRSRDGVT